MPDQKEKTEAKVRQNAFIKRRFHRASAAVEVVIFIIARRMVNPTISSLDSLAGALALAGLIIVSCLRGNES